MAHSTTVEERWGPVSPERSDIMRRVAQRHTRPELIVRSVIHRLGYRFRLHRLDLPGTPDVVLSSRRKVVFVHGCFWHRHPGCRRASTPKTRVEFWMEKFENTLERDRRSQDSLEAAGWSVLTIWSCELSDTAALEQRLRKFLGPPRAGS